MEAAEEVLSHEEQHQLDWFQESAGFLEPLSEHWKFLKARWDAHKAVRTLGSGGADEAQEGRFEGKKVWRAIHDMQ